MFNLIIPPIIIVVAIALLIIFLARVVPKSEGEARKKQLKRSNFKAEKKVVADDSVDIVNNSTTSIKAAVIKDSAEANEVASENKLKSVEKIDEVANEFIQPPVEGLKPRKEFKAKKDKNSGFKAFIGKLNFFSKKAKKGNITLPGINRMDGIKRTAPVNFTQNNEENLSRMDKILLDSRNITKSPDSSNNEESELVRQISVDPRNPESYRRLGDFYVEGDRLTDARECYKYVLRLDPKHRRAQLAMKRLDRILG